MLTIPALRRLAEQHQDTGVDIWCPLDRTPVLEMADLPAAVIPIPPGRGIWRTAAWLRRVGYAKAYLFTRVPEAALAARFAGIRELRGMAGPGTRWLLGRRENRVAFDAGHRVSAFMRVADPAWSSDRPPAPRLAVPDRATEQFHGLVAGRLERPAVAIVPGARSPARRWPEGRYTALAGLLAAEVGSVVVFGSPRDGVLATRVAAGAGRRGIDLGGRTSPTVLAAGLAACDLVVANDGGALQLAAAVGAPVVGLFGSRAPGQAGPIGGTSRILWRSSLPCAPCGREACPRRGAGTVLPEAREECLRLISVEAVTRAVRELLEQVGAASNG